MLWESPRSGAAAESAGKRRPSGSRHGNTWLAAMLVKATGSIGRMKGTKYLSRRNDEAHARQPVAQLERLGHTVVLDPVA